MKKFSFKTCDLCHHYPTIPPTGKSLFSADLAAHQLYKLVCNSLIPDMHSRGLDQNLNKHCTMLTGKQFPECKAWNLNGIHYKSVWWTRTLSQLTCFLICVHPGNKGSLWNSEVRKCQAKRKVFSKLCTDQGRRQPCPGFPQVSSPFQCRQVSKL